MCGATPRTMKDNTIAGNVQHTLVAFMVSDKLLVARITRKEANLTVESRLEQFVMGHWERSKAMQLLGMFSTYWRLVVSDKFVFVARIERREANLTAESSLEQSVKLRRDAICHGSKSNSEKQPWTICGKTLKTIKDNAIAVNVQHILGALVVSDKLIFWRMELEKINKSDSGNSLEQFVMRRWGR